MTARSLSLLAAVMLAGATAPALAQERYDPGEPPPLPELSEHEWDDWDADPREVYPDRPGEWASRDLPPPHGAEPGHRMGYRPEQRAAWLDECRARISAEVRGPLDECEAYLLDYERSYAPPARGGYGFGYGHHGEDYASGYSGPVRWVKVPIVRERCDCDCAEVTEETVIEPAPAPVKRTKAQRLAPGKAQRLKPVK